jgi:tRNA threonylcarbamoyl adenosine modification protein YeaZ
MKYLFIDTHSEDLEMALIMPDKVKTLKRMSHHSHSEIAIPTLNELLNDENILLKDIDEIIVVNGPGSFTGVRIGVTIAKTIAYSLNIKIKTITSLEAYGISDANDFDLITVPDSKGVYSARLINGKFTDFTYQKTSDFEEYVKLSGYKVSENKEIDYEKIITYLKDTEPINPHSVNPIYIKEIDALK